MKYPPRAIASIVLTLVTLPCVPLAAAAQPAGKVYRIGMLKDTPEAANVANLDAFRKALGDLGYVEGRHVVLEYRSAEGRPQRFVELARELVRLDVDVIVTRTTPAALSAKQVTRTIPIVMASSDDPVAEGIVRHLARPEGNVTGFHAMAPPELGGQRRQLLKEALPGLSRVGILWNSADIQSPLIVRATERMARAMGLRLKSLEVQRAWPSRAGNAFDQAFEDALFGQVDAAPSRLHRAVTGHVRRWRT